MTTALAAEQARAFRNDLESRAKEQAEQSATTLAQAKAWATFAHAVNGLEKQGCLGTVTVTIADRLRPDVLMTGEITGERHAGTITPQAPTLPVKEVDEPTKTEGTERIYFPPQIKVERYYGYLPGEGAAPAATTEADSNRQWSSTTLRFRPTATTTEPDTPVTGVITGEPRAGKITPATAPRPIKVGDVMQEVHDTKLPVGTQLVDCEGDYVIVTINGLLIQRSEDPTLHQRTGDGCAPYTVTWVPPSVPEPVVLDALPDMAEGSAVLSSECGVLIAFRWDGNKEWRDVRGWAVTGETKYGTLTLLYDAGAEK